MELTETIPLDTEYGQLECSYFEAGSGEECLLIVRRPWIAPPFVRLHSACMFSESIHSIDCDCARQLDASLKIISEQGGVIVYLFQEGRGIGLRGKIRAIRQQINKNIDTAAAFAELGHAPDVRDYSCAAEALKAVGVSGPIRLATNNPAKIEHMREQGFDVQSRISLEIETNPQIESYLRMKRQALGHI